MPREPIRLSLKGSFPKGLPLLGSAKSEFKKLVKLLQKEFEGMVVGMGTDEEEGGNVFTLTKTIHPIANPIRIRVRRPDQITIEAVTGNIGPGYHQFLCETFTSVGIKLGIIWEIGPQSDPTGFFLKQDRWNLEGAFLSLLSDETIDLLEAYQNGGRELCLLTPTPDLFRHKGIIQTPMGPRHLDWVERVAANPRAGIDVFCWWDPGRGPGYHHGRAWSILWNHARLRQPLNPLEEALWKDMLDCFEKAYQVDVRLKYPWSEWHRFLSMTSRPPSDPVVAAVGERAAREKTELDPDPRLYRKGEYTAVFPMGWRVILPADFAEQFNPATRVWMGWNGRRTVQIQEAPIRDPDEPDSGPERVIEEFAGLGAAADTEDMRWAKKGIHSRARVQRVESGDRVYFRLNSISAVRGSMMHCVINFDDAADREWAITLWRSVEFVRPPMPRP